MAPPAGLPGGPGAGGVDTDAALVALWLADRPETTRAAYTADLEWWHRHGLPRDLRGLRLAHIHAALEAGRAAGGRPATIARRIAGLRSLLAWGHRVGYLVLDVGALLRPGRVPSELAERILDAEEVTRLLVAAGQAPRQGKRDHLLVRLAYVTGARVAELVRLDWAHVHDGAEGGATLTLHGKGGRTRHVWITPGTRAELEAFQGWDGWGVEGPILRARTGKRLSVRDAERAIEAAAERAQIRHCSPHFLRHAHATHALERGAAIHEVADQLGHASVATTSRYLHVRPGPGSARWLGL